MVNISMTKEDIMAALEGLQMYIQSGQDRTGSSRRLYEKILFKAKKESPLIYKDWY